MSQAASTSHEKDVLRVLARVTKSQQKYPHDIPAVVNIKSSTTFLRHKASTLSTELHHCVRWGDKARQDILEKRLRRIHRDLMVLRGRSNEATAGATQVLLAPITKTKTPAHDKGGQWLVSMCKTRTITWYRLLPPICFVVPNGIGITIIVSNTRWCRPPPVCIPTF